MLLDLLTIYLTASRTGWVFRRGKVELLISGTSDYILVKSPWWLIKNLEVCYERTSDNESYSAPFAGYVLRYEMADFAGNINKPKAQNYRLAVDNPTAMSEIIEGFRKGK